jgi:type II secretory pathway pseudopilin PulG
MKKRHSGVTLIEILAVALVLSLVIGVIYQLFQGTWLNVFKTQTKLTNLRAATILLEHLKHDMRLAVASSPYRLASDATSVDLEFRTTTLQGNRQQVKYRFSDGTIRREAGGTARDINQARVNAFSLSLHSLGTKTCLRVLIEVDAEKGELRPSESGPSNRIVLTAALFPRFLHGGATKEEEYWFHARRP